MVLYIRDHLQHPPPNYHIHTLAVQLNPLAVVIQGRFGLQASLGVPPSFCSLLGWLPSQKVFKVWVKSGWGTKVPSHQLTSVGHPSPGQGTLSNAMFSKGDPSPGSDRAGGGAHLFTGFPVQPTTKGTCYCWLGSWHLL